MGQFTNYSYYHLSPKLCFLVGVDRPQLIAFSRCFPLFPVLAMMTPESVKKLEGT